MGYFNLDAFEGLATTEYILDASTVSSTTLASMATKTGTGSVTLDGTLNTPGGRIKLNTSTTGDTATIKLPLSFGNVSGSVVGWEYSLLGVSSTTERSELDLSTRVSSTNFQNILWNSVGITGNVAASSGETTQIIKQGAFNVLESADMGFLVDYRTTTLRNFKAHVGGTQVEILSPGLGGVYAPDLTLTGNGTNSVTFRQMNLKVFWGVKGEKITKLY